MNTATRLLAMTGRALAAAVTMGVGPASAATKAPAPELPAMLLEQQAEAAALPSCRIAPTMTRAPKVFLRLIGAALSTTGPPGR